VQAWAALGLAYVEQARVTGDATFYSKAEEACAEGTRIGPRDARVLTARAALAAARHDFTDALRLADEALAIAPDNASTTAVRADALTELGRYDDALDAAEAADGLRPSLSTFARLSYAYELRGDLPRATQLMTRAADAATTREDTAFARALLGDLARRQGKRSMAAQQYSIALKASPAHLPALAGQAKLLAAGGKPDQAITAYESIVARAPLPEHLVALGELYAANGRAADARAQYDIVRATTALAQANGVTTDLEAALFEADHGDSAAAVRMARAEWARRQSIHVADALAWALHAAGRDKEALGFARRATALGTKDAHLLYHRGAIEAAVGLRADAVKHLRAALAADPYFSPFSAPRARALLTSLESTS
jgi:tetratricopeptide (TPR) repeat protein